MKWEWVVQPVPGPAADDPKAMRGILKRVAEKLEKELVIPGPRPGGTGAQGREAAAEKGGEEPARPHAIVTKDVYGKVLGEVGDPERSERFLAEARDSQDAMNLEQHAAETERGRLELPGWGLAGVLLAFLGLRWLLPGSGPGLAPMIIGVLAFALAGCVARRLWLRHYYWQRATAAEERWETVLKDKVLKPYLIQQMNDSVDRREVTVVGADIRPTDYGHDPEYAVVSAVMTKVSDASRTVTAGSIGISGPRGAGKTTILHKLDTRIDRSKAEQDIRVYVSAPVDYDPRDFIIHLFTELCAKVLAEAPALSSIAAQSRRQLSRLRFLSTYSSAWGPGLVPSALLTPLGLGSLAGAFGSLAWSPGKQKAEQPAGLPEIVKQLRAYSRDVAQWARTSRGHSEGRVIICIDEMDKIRDSSRAEQFLNGIKAIFDVPGCLYLVSISEDAMAVFASQTPAIKTAFDSAFDEIISVGPMNFAEARELLGLRVIGLPLPFLALCHVLAGGVPRELIRAARSLYQVTRESDPKPEPKPESAPKPPSAPSPAPKPGSASEQKPAPASKPALPVLVGLDTLTRRLVGDRCEVMRQQAILQLGGKGAPPGILQPLYQPDWPGKAPDEMTDAADVLTRAAAGLANDELRGMCVDVEVALLFYATVVELFTDKDKIAELFGKPGEDAKAGNDEGAKPGDNEDVTHAVYPRIDGLATVRHAMRMNSEVARALLKEWRGEPPEGDGSAGN